MCFDSIQEALSPISSLIYPGRGDICLLPDTQSKRLEGQKFKVILAYEASLWPARGTRDFGSEKKYILKINKKNLECLTLE